MDHHFSNHPAIGLASTFSELVNTDFQGDTNAICWYRKLAGDFEEIVSELALKANITEVSAEDLLSLELSENGAAAREIILNDLKLLQDFGALPSLNLIKKYDRDDEFDFISTDVYSYHVDRSPIATDTFLCTYYGPASDVLPTEEAIQKIKIPEIRAKLAALHDGPENELEAFLKDNYFDLHYKAKDGAEPINLGNGHLWKLAVDHPEQKVPPCVHRAPAENDGDYRFLLIC